MVPSAGPCVALSSARTNETVNQRSTIRTDPGATRRQLGYILKRRMLFHQKKKNEASLRCCCWWCPAKKEGSPPPQSSQLGNPPSPHSEGVRLMIPPYSAEEFRLESLWKMKLLGQSPIFFSFCKQGLIVLELEWIFFLSADRRSLFRANQCLAQASKLPLCVYLFPRCLKWSPRCLMWSVAVPPFSLRNPSFLWLWQQMVVQMGTFHQSLRSGGHGNM